MDKLMGGTVEEISEVYAKRSPVNNAQNIRSPLLVSRASMPGGDYRSTDTNIALAGNRGQGSAARAGRGHREDHASTRKSC